MVEAPFLNRLPHEKIFYVDEDDEGEKKPLPEAIPNSVINYHEGKGVYILQPGHMKRYSMLS